jgi:HPt (histidine-containing phosphotransfer) domain-containing protein
MADHDVPTFDHDHLAEVCGDDLDVQREIVDDFLSKLDARLDEIGVAVASRDAAAIRHAAHTLKGASASLGAPALAESSARLESLGRAGALDGATAALEQTRHEAVRLREALAGFPRDRAA